MSSLSGAKRALKIKNVRVAAIVEQKRFEKQIDKFSNRRSQRKEPLTGYTTAQLMYPTDNPVDKVVAESVVEDTSKKE